MKKIFVFFICFIVMAANAQTRTGQRTARSATASRTDSRNASSRIRVNSVQEARTNDSDDEERPAARTTRSARSAAPARGATARTARSATTRSATARTARSTRTAAAPATTAQPSRTARSASTRTSARTARSATSSAAARTTRTARSATPSATARTTRSARATAATSATPARQTRSARTTGVQINSSARTARSATTRARSAVGSRAVSSASGNTARAAVGRVSVAGTGTAIASAPVSRSAADTGSTEQVYDNVNSTPASTSAVDYSSAVAEEEPVAKTAEEVALTISNEKTCLSSYTSCMDQFCKDTSEDGVAGRCLCSASIVSLKSKETEAKKYIAGVNLVQQQINAIDVALKESTNTGKDFMEVLKNQTAVVALGMGDQLTSAEQLISAMSDSNNEIYTGAVNDSTIRKEGDALLKEANKACTAHLELCPGSESKIKDSYSIQAGNDCRGYSKDLDDKLFNEKLKWEQSLSKFSSKALSGKLTTTNKYGAQECTEKLDTCMRRDIACGEDLSLCYNDATTEAKKEMCKDILSQCQGVNMPYVANESNRTDAQTDVLWKAFKRSIFQKTQLSNMQCQEQLETCAKEKCGEDGMKCMPKDGNVRTKTETYAEFNKNLETLCADIAVRCAAGY